MRTKFAIRCLSLPRLWRRRFNSCGVTGRRFDYDLLVLGGGSGGLACAKEASRHGARVVVLDYVTPSTQGTTWGLGGTCVNVGCIPKKLFHQAGLLKQAIRDAPSYGWLLEDGAPLDHSWSGLTSAVRDHIHSLNWGHRVQLKQKNIDFFNAFGSFCDSHTIKLVNPQGETSHLTADHIVIAVGGRPRLPETVAGAEECGITSDDLFYLANPPGKTLVIGGSYIALECAGILASLGQPTSLMVRSQCLKTFDQELVSLVIESLEREGVEVMWGCEPKKVKRNPGKMRSQGGEVGEEAGGGGGGGLLEVTWYESGTTTHQEEWDTVLFATGRRPGTRSLALSLAGVSLDDEGKVVVDETDQTSAPNIYAIGDVASSRWELTPVAIESGRRLSQRLFAGSAELMDYQNVPTTVFTPLELASVGLTEEAAARVHGESSVQVYHAFYQPLEYYLPSRESGSCYVKLVCVGEEERVVGLHMTGPNAGEMMQGFAVAIRLGVTYTELVSTVGIHPTSAEEVVKLHITKASGNDPTVTAC